MLEEQIKSGELTRNTRTVDNADAANENRGQKKQKEKNDEMAGPSGLEVTMLCAGKGLKQRSKEMCQRRKIKPQLR